MLQKNQRYDLQILYFALKSQVRLPVLADFLNLNQRTVRDRIRIMNQTLENEFDFSDVITIQIDGTISINPQYSDERLLLFYKLKLLYLKETYEFQILSYLFLNYQKSNDELCDDLFITKSYLFRIIKKINRNLKTLEIHIENINNQLYIKGDEVIIRLLGFLMISDAYQSLEWPYEKVDKVELLAYLPYEEDMIANKLSQAKKDHLLHFFALLSVRFNNHEFVQLRHDPKLRELLEMLKENYDLAKIYEEEITLKLPHVNQMAENLYFNFVSRIYLADFIPDIKKLSMGKKLFCSNNYFSNLAKQLLAKIETEVTFIITTSEEHFIIYELTLFFAYTYFLGNKMPALNNYVFEVPHFRITAESEYSDKIDQLVQSFIKENDISFLESKSTFFTLSNLVRTGIQIQACKPTQVYLHITKDFTEKAILEEMIKKIFNPSSVKITRNFSQADILITDTFEPVNSELKFYYFDGLQNQNQWPGLIHLIEETILEKMFASHHDLLINN